MRTGSRNSGLIHRDLCPVGHCNKHICRTQTVSLEETDDAKHFTDGGTEAWTNHTARRMRSSLRRLAMGSTSFFTSQLCEPGQVTTSLSPFPEAPRVMITVASESSGINEMACVSSGRRQHHQQNCHHHAAPCRQVRSVEYASPMYISQMVAR